MVFAKEKISYHQEKSIPLRIIDFGLKTFPQAMILMEQVHTEVCSTPNHNGYLLIGEHPPTVTMGLRPLWEDMKSSVEKLEFLKIDFQKTDRGGSVTVHEPGQMVAYPIIPLSSYRLNVKDYVALLEESVIETCKQFQVNATRDFINPGVWLGLKKIAAIGIRVKEKVSKHGVAFNLTNNLATFDHITPCGLKTRGVISLQGQLEAQGQKIDSPLLLKKQAQQFFCDFLHTKLLKLKFD